MAVSHPGNRDAAAQQRPHCSNGSVCMNRKTKKFYYLESKVKLTRIFGCLRHPYIRPSCMGR